LILTEYARALVACKRQTGADFLIQPNGVFTAEFLDERNLERVAIKMGRGQSLSGEQ
jgi:hypothetical protein